MLNDQEMLIMSDLIQRAKHWMTQWYNESSIKFEPIVGDASSRTYFRIWIEDRSYILMHADAIKENSHAFIAIAQALREGGVRAPLVMQSDLNLGFMLMEDLGDDLVFKQYESAYSDVLILKAIDVILDINACPLPKGYSLPAFDGQILNREWALFTDWFISHKCQIQLNAQEQQDLQNVFEQISNIFQSQPQVFVHRDFHAANVLMGEPLGVIDFQDAVTGPITYDLVSFLEDRYLSFSKEKLSEFVKVHYEKVKQIGLIKSEISFEEYKRWFDFVGLQRNLKIIGIFSRLELRDHKYGYQAFMPRFICYIIECANDYPELKVISEFMKMKALPRYESLKPGETYDQERYDPVCR